jgi:phenylacetate-CoA ligase
MNPISRRRRQDIEASEARRRAVAASDRSRIPAIQLDALQRVWADAISDVPYYAQLVNSGHAPRELRSWDEARSIPELHRQVLQSHPELFVRRSRPPEGVAITGGSTAAPLRIGMDQQERDLMRVVKLGAWQSLGYTPSSRLFLMWGHGHLEGTGWRRQVNRAKRRMADAALGYRRVDAYRLSRAICLAYAEDIIRQRPIGIIGYASALDLLARYAQPLRDRIRAAGVRFVLSTSEPPPRPDSIDVIEDLFGCPLVQEYGGVDIGQVAFASGRGSFEVYGDLNHLECDADGAAVLTSLYQRYTPLIRYRVGDQLESPETLANGHVASFAAVAGRINDVLTFDDGQSVYGLAALHCVHDEAAIHQVQFVITDSGVTIDVVADAADHSAMEQRIRTRLAELHPMLERASFRYVEDVQTSLAGKRRWFVDRRGANRRAEGTG